LTTRGEAFEVLEYLVGFDFAQQGRPSFIDNYIEVHELPVLGNLRVGHFFEPFSLERFGSNRNLSFMERSLGDTFSPARNTGMMAHDTIGDDDRGTWAVGWFRSNSNDFGDDTGDTGEQAVTSRLTWLPFYEADGRSFMHVGGGYSYRSADNRLVRFSTRPEARLGTQSADIPAFVDTGLIPAINDQRFSAEWAWVRGPLYFQTEYMHSVVNQIGGPRLNFKGGYAFVSYFLTGESRTYNKKLGIMDRVFPFENFFRVGTDHGIETGKGAWEVAARYSFIDLNDKNIAGGLLQDVTIGLNWHLNPYTRIRWEYINANLDRRAAPQTTTHIAGMRFDMDF
jgi:phosphate-selective porin OprO/OprP